MQQGEESPDNAEQCASEREDVREGIVSEKRMTSRHEEAKPAFAEATAGKGEKAG